MGIGRSLIPADVEKFLQTTTGNGTEYNDVSDLLMARIRPYSLHSTMEGNSYNESYDIYDELSAKIDKEKINFQSEVKRKHNYWETLMEYQKEMVQVAVEMAQIREKNSKELNGISTNNVTHTINSTGDD